MLPIRQRARLISAIALMVAIAFFTPPGRSHAQESSQAMLAVIDEKGNLSVFDEQGQNPIRITTDADGQQRAYQWPTWSTDGRLAFFGASTDSNDLYRLRVLIQEEIKPGEPYQVAYSSPDDIFTYAYWSPGNCDTGNCRDLALLYTPANQNGLAVRMIRDRQGKFTDKIIGRASPFYYSFSPDGQKMLWHLFGTTLEVYDVKTDQIITTLDDAPGHFQSPMWSPVGDQLLYAVASDNPDHSDIIVLDGTKRRTLVRDLEGSVSFAWSPDASMIASVANFGQVVVTDVKTGKTVATSYQNTVVAHFWSPQGDRVAYIGYQSSPNQTQARYRYNGNGNGRSAAAGTPAPNDNSLTWYVLDVKTGKERALSSFLPSRDMIYYLNFFDQFARSHSLWSPDGRYLAYGVTDSFGQSAVMLTDTLTPGAPIMISTGSIGIWSWK